MSLRANAGIVSGYLSETTIPLILSQFRSRSLDRPPASRLRISVTIPAQNEEDLIEDCLHGLKAQVDRWGDPLDPDLYEVILLVNNSTDRSVEIAHRFASLYPDFRLHIIDIVLAPRHAHVGWARRLAMEEALGRFRHMRHPGGVIAATDADTVVAPDWVAETLAAVDAGAEGVGGRLMLPPVSLLDAEPRLREATLRHRRYERLTHRLASLLDPDPFDHWPRHGDHGGASLAATAHAYARAGGMPAVATGEDHAFYARLKRTGTRFRHSNRVRVFTSDRQDGRAAGGMAATLAAWRSHLANGNDILVECPDAVVGRLTANLHGPGNRVPLEEALPALGRRVMELR
jgi:glycosyltransferase involved in cell wall biosynthesis